MGDRNTFSESSLLLERDESFRRLVETVQDYAIFLMSPDHVLTWNLGAERIKAFKADEIIGQHFSRFYTHEARESGWPDRELEIAGREGRFADEGWRVKKDGTLLWASVTITAIYGSSGELRGFSKVTRDLTERRALEEKTQELNKELRTRMTELLESRNQLELRTLELQRLSGQFLAIQDEKRRRIARELHDDLGQELAALKMTLDLKNQKQSGALNDEVETAERANQRVRNLSYLLHPPLLDESGRVPALHWFVDGFKRRSTLKISLECKPTAFPRLQKEIETAIYRIVQESVSNVYRHSGSPNARIGIHQHTDRVVIRIRDFGKGMALMGSRPVNIGVGIAGIRERLKQFGGDLKIVRAEPGTLIEANIPLFQGIKDVRGRV